LKKAHNLVLGLLDGRFRVKNGVRCGSLRLLVVLGKL
jgi:hypothetical protein